MNTSINILPLSNSSPICWQGNWGNPDVWMVKPWIFWECGTWSKWFPRFSKWGLVATESARHHPKSAKSVIISLFHYLSDGFLHHRCHHLSTPNLFKGKITGNIKNGKIYGFRLRFSLKPIHWIYLHRNKPQVFQHQGTILKSAI